MQKLSQIPQASVECLGDPADEDSQKIRLARRLEAEGHQVIAIGRSLVTLARTEVEGEAPRECRSTQLLKVAFYSDPDVSGNDQPSVLFLEGGRYGFGSGWLQISAPDGRERIFELRQRLVRDFDGSSGRRRFWDDDPEIPGRIVDAREAEDILSPILALGVFGGPPFWTPDKPDVLALERALPEFLKQQRQPIDLRAHRRDYYGVTRDGRRLVLVAGTPWDREGSWPELAAGAGSPPFQVFFDPAAQSLIDLRVSGRLF